MKKLSSKIKIILPTDGELLGVAGDNYRVVLSGEQTGGEFAVFDMLIPPGGGPAPHSHSEIEEFFYVMEGELTFKTSEGKIIVAKGGTVHIPKGGDIHAFKNDSKELARVLCTVMPSGLEEFFSIIGQPVGVGEFVPKPEMTAEIEKKIHALHTKFKQRVYPIDYLD